MNDQLLKRIASLTAEKRQLFERLVADDDRRNVSTPASPDAPRPADRLEEAALSRLADPAARRSQADGIKREYRRVYNSVSEQLDSSPVGKHARFCNFGYTPTASPQYSQVALPENILNRHTIRLVLEVVGDCPLADCRVLDVGCGRGGTVWVMATYYTPRQVVGLDLSAAAIKFCRRSRVADGNAFVEGDAENLPFQPGSFDVVANVESSHSYPSLRSFYQEVSRVLKVGGYFLYTDLFSSEQWPANLELLGAHGFIVERDRDITANVLLSCDETAPGKLTAYNPHNDSGFMSNFLGTPDSEVYRLMKSRAWTYRALKLRNAGPRAALSPQSRDLPEPVRKEPKGQALRSPIARRERAGDTAPLSFAQQRLWFLDQLLPGNPAYNICVPMPWPAPLDVKAMAQSLQEIVHRHESLRTSFEVEGGEPVQRVHAVATVPLTVLDLRALSDADREHTIRRVMAEETNWAFDLERGPLIRTRLLQLDDQSYLFLLNLHHIVSDAWSMSVFYREFAALYPALCAGAPSPLPDLPIQYADFAAWQREALSGPVLDSHLSYWKERLADLPELALPTDRPRPPVQTFRGCSHNVRLPASLTASLQALSRREGVTLFITLLAAFQVLLHRYAAQDDIVVGAPVAGRTRAELEGLIGFFVNTLVLRTDLSGDPPFREALSRVREVSLGAYAHQDLPFEKLVEELQPARDLSRNPLFQVMFHLQTTPQVGQSASETSQLPVELDKSTSLFDLAVHLFETARGLEGHVQYNSDLFDATTIRRLMDNYTTLLEGVIADPDGRLSALPLMTGVERLLTLERWNDTREDYRLDLCVHQLFERQAERTPDAIAVTCGGGQLTFGELNTRSNQLAHYLRRLPIGPDTPVGLCVDRSLDLPVGLLGILKAGGAYLPLDPAYPAERLTFMRRDSGAPVVVTVGRLPSAVTAGASAVVYLDREQQKIAEMSREPAQTGVRPSNLAYVLYTSGSTGHPKGVAMPHRPLVNLLMWQGTRSRAPQSSRTLQWTPLSFDVSFQEIFSSWLAGGTLVISGDAEQRDAVSLVRALSEGRVNRLFLPFVALQQLAECAADYETGPLHLREVITAGEQLQVTPQITSFFDRLRDCALHNHYGPTEAHVVTACALPPDPQSWPALPPIGGPIANVQTYVLDQNLNPVPIGVVGELHLSGECLARGYLGHPELTAEKFVPHPLSGQPGARLYRTGDRARWRADGQLEFLGRLDRQVKIRGFRVELGEVEAVLGQHPAIREVVVVARENGVGHQLIAYVVPGTAPLDSRADLRGWLQARLPDHLIPSGFVVLDKVPLTPSGKIDRRALPAPDQSWAGARESYAPPRTSMEEALVDVWKDLLGLDRVGIHDNFFELGGHSLLGTRLVSRVRRGFRAEIPIRRLFEAPTVAEFALVVSEHQAQHPPEVAGTGVVMPTRAQAPLEVETLSDDEVDALLTQILREDPAPE